VRIRAWEVAQAAPGTPPEELEWLPEMPDEPDVDAYDWWFRSVFANHDGGEVLRFGGIATVSDVWLNGEPILESESMFLHHEVDVAGRLEEQNELLIHCRALKPLLAVRRKPRARWRTAIASDGNLRWFRTSIMGRAPGFAPGPPVVGPWRPVTLEPRRHRHAIRTRLDGEDGVVQVDGDDVAEVEVAGHTSQGGELRIPGVDLWWPHTHGDPVLHDLHVNGELAARVGFRSLTPPPSIEVNGVPVFARGALWTPVPDDQLRPTLEAARAAGMNTIRIPGTGAYESPEFWDLCDELGLLVWQDFMFANFDYPVSDPDFRALVEREAEQVLADIGWRPSLAVLCGNSEVEQQVGMLGLDPEMGRGELFGELLPEAIRASGADVPYVPSSPSGGELPFRNDAGVAHYFGVGGYRRPLEDARRAEVKFASECLAIANQPDSGETGGVPRDAGADWDFQDVRDHYLKLLFGADRDDDRYLELSRFVSGEVMAEVFGEWRRGASPCGGGLILWLRDLLPGSGWGVLDSTGAPKVAYHYLRRALAPIAVWTTDEGLGGIAAHVANDRPEPLSARLRVALYRDLEVRVEEAEEEIQLPPHSVAVREVESVLGHFADVSYAYRFGPPQHDAVVVSLESAAGELLAQAFRFPVGQPLAQEDLGLEAERDGDVLTLRTRKLAYGVRIHEAAVTSDNAFSIEPGQERVVRAPGATALTALNLSGQLRLAT
jgi:beta-mannosidase